MTARLHPKLTIFGQRAQGRGDCSCMSTPPCTMLLEDPKAGSDDA
jgi:hypothetical protein